MSDNFQQCLPLIDTKHKTNTPTQNTTEYQNDRRSNMGKWEHCNMINKIM